MLTTNNFFFIKQIFKVRQDTKIINSTKPTNNKKKITHLTTHDPYKGSNFLFIKKQSSDYPCLHQHFTHILKCFIKNIYFFLCESGSLSVDRRTIDSLIKPLS